MSWEGCDESVIQDEYLYFSKERMLRWLRWFRGNKDLHPELSAFEKSQKKTIRQSRLHRWLRKSL